eukprot:8156889-Alexandrium_andersonii.AAC.1
MSASLVGSEMCIRDSLPAHPSRLVLGWRAPPRARPRGLATPTPAVESSCGEAGAWRAHAERRVRRGNERRR